MEGEGSKSRNRRAWKRWALLFGLPGAVVALGSVWLYEPSTLAEAALASGIAVIALLVFALTMPYGTSRRRRRSRPPSPDEPA
jgi:ABC-type Fe3+ transport system permease subunit